MPFSDGSYAANCVILIGNPNDENDVECRCCVIEKLGHNRFHTCNWNEKKYERFNYALWMNSVWFPPVNFNANFISDCFFYRDKSTLNAVSRSFGWQPIKYQYRRQNKTALRQQTSRRDAKTGQSSIWGGIISQRNFSCASYSLLFSFCASCCGVQTMRNIYILRLLLAYALV